MKVIILIKESKFLILIKKIKVCAKTPKGSEPALWSRVKSILLENYREKHFD